MKVQGQLEVAQLEQIASASPTPTPTGRTYIDVTNAAKGVMRVYDGTSWRQVPFTQSSAFISQNSGTACTVDWSTGLFQQVVLTGHATISFSNPQSGQEHVLVVQQRVQETGSGYATPYVYKLNMIDQDPRRGPYQPTTCPQSSESHMYRWFYSAGVKAAYGTLPQVFGNPSSLPAAASSGIDISPDGRYICSGHTSSPFQSVYPVYDGGGIFFYGAKNIVTPQTPAAAINSVCYSPDGSQIFLVSGTTPFIQGYNVDRGTSFAVFANPGTLPTGAGQCVAMHPAGLAVAIGHTTTPFMSAYPLVSLGYGSKYTNPATLPDAQVNALAFSPNGDYLAGVSQTTPFLRVWPFDPITGFGAVVANPSSLPAGGPAGSIGKGVAWRPQGDYIAVAMSTTPYLYIVSFNRATGAFGGTVSTALSGIAATVNCLQWTPDGQYLICGNATSLYIYDFSAQTIGAAISLDVAAPGVTINDLVVTPNGENVILSLASSPFVKTYALPRKVRNYLRLVGPETNPWTK